MVEKVSAAAGRRIALAAQGFGRPQPASVGTRQLNAMIERLRLLQLDSVNVFERSHYLPLFARLGAYDKALLDRLTFSTKARYVETWAHVASLIPLESWPLWRWRQRRMREKHFSKPASWAHSNAAMLDWLRSELAARGPVRVSEIEHEANRRKGTWWEWSDVKLGLEYLFDWGEVVPAGRRNFERIYALAEHVIPADLLELEVPEEEAHYLLMRDAVRAHGIGTLGDFADYYRLRNDRAKVALQRLVDEGEALPVRVAGWPDRHPHQAYLHRDARIPRSITAAALLSPFDPIVWERDRALRMFGFHYRIEIYTPPPKRLFGYYTLPVLVDDELVGRIDLKSDRQARVLRVQSAWYEEGHGAEVVERIMPAVRAAAAWQGLHGFVVQDWGTMAGELARQLGVPVAPRNE